MKNFLEKINLYEDKVLKNNNFSVEQKEQYLQYLSKLEGIIQDYKLNGLKLTNELKNILNETEAIFNNLLNNEKVLINIHKITSKLDKYLDNYKKEISNSLIDNIEWYYLWVEKWLQDLGVYIKEDIYWLIEFFSNIENIKKLPDFIFFLVKNFSSIIDAMWNDIKNKLFDIREDISALTSLHDKNEISDKLFNYKITSLSIFLTWIIIYELISLKKISKVKDLSHLEKVILENIDKKKVNKVSIKELDKSLVYEKLSNNFPLLAINRLTKGSVVFNFNFKWIKHLNDRFWQANVDILLNLIKNKILLDIWENKDRLIRNNYKNLTLTVKQENINLQVDIGDIIIKNKDKFNLSDSDIILFKEFAKKYMDLWIWVSKVKSDKLEDKLKAFYNAEITSKISKKLSVMRFSEELILDKAKKVVKLESEILKKFENKQFLVNWYKYDVIVNDFNWNKVINPVLLRAVRKENKILDLNWKEYSELEKYISWYLKELNEWFDFIAPYTNLSSDIKEIENIEKQFKKWKISIDYFVNTYKWTISKDLFFKYVDGKSWSLYFIDIKDMWIMNLEEFKVIAKKLANGEKVDLTSAWKITTSKFINFANNIIKSCPKCKISIWWDEIYIYSDNSKLLWKVNKYLESSWLSWRIIKYNWHITSDSFEILDKNTKLIKQLEIIIEWLKIKNIKNVVLLENTVDLTKFSISFNKNSLKNLGKDFVQIWTIWDKKIYWKKKNGLLILTVK